MVELKPRQVLHHWRLPMEHIYFVAGGLVSVSAKMDDGRSVEAWLTGSEGMIGAPCVLAPDDTSPPHRRVVQVGGTAIRLSSAAFIAALEDVPSLRKLILRYINVVIFQTSQSGACNALHSVKQRLARWLLLAKNALDSSDWPITRSVLAQLLGVRRASISECLEAFEKRGITKNARGTMKVLDQVSLEHTACSCVGSIQREYDRQIGRLVSAEAANRTRLTRERRP